MDDGGFLVEYGTPKVTFALRDDRWIFRAVNGRWVPLYRTHESLNVLLRNIRNSPHLTIFVDHCVDPVPTAGSDLQERGQRRRRQRYEGGREAITAPRTLPDASTIKTRREAFAMADEKPLREGAKYLALLEKLPLNKTEKAKLAKEAEAIARERGDRIVRDYYLYLASDMEMPDETKRRWRHFESTGKELTGAKDADNKKKPRKEKKGPPTKPRARTPKKKPQEKSSPEPSEPPKEPSNELGETATGDDGATPTEETQTL